MCFSAQEMMVKYFSLLIRCYPSQRKRKSGGEIAARRRGNIPNIHKVRLKRFVMKIQTL